MAVAQEPPPKTVYRFITCILLFSPRVSKERLRHKGTKNYQNEKIFPVTRQPFPQLS